MLSIIIKAYQFLQADFWYVRNRTKLAFQKKSSIAIKASKIWGKKMQVIYKTYCMNCNQIHNFNLNGRAKIFYGNIILVILN